MNGSTTPNAWFELRQLMEPLVECFEVTDPLNGIVGIVPVVGGRFIHPLTHESIHKLKIYGAGKDRVKIIEPRFLYSLPLTPIGGLAHPAQFCSRVAKNLGGILERLKTVRDNAVAWGIGLDLEPDVLRLRGRTDLKGISVELLAGDSGRITISAIGKRTLGGLIPGQQRSLELTNGGAGDLDALVHLARTLDERLRRQELETMERSLGVTKAKGMDVINPKAPSPTFPNPALTRPIIPSPAVPSSVVPSPVEASPVVSRLATSSPQPALRQSTAEKAKPTKKSGEAIPLFELSLGTNPADDLDILSPPPVDNPVKTIEESSARPVFAQGTSEVLELTEMVEVDRKVGAELDAKKPPVIDEPSSLEQPLGAVRIKEMIDKLGSEAEISAQGGRLRLVVPLKVVQGRFVFYLQQSSPTGFKGVMVTPRNVKHPVEFDLKSILDIKEVFDRILLGK